MEVEDSIITGHCVDATGDRSDGAGDKSRNAGLYQEIKKDEEILFGVFKSVFFGRVVKTHMDY